MTVTSTELTVGMDSDTELFLHLDSEFEIACEMPDRLKGSTSYRPHDDAASWVAWRSACCPESPRYLLVCNDCAEMFRRLRAHLGYVTCVDCDKECEIVSITELNKART